MWKEFKDFIDRGNVMDMAVGIIMGSATTTVVNALVDDILSPIIGMFLGGVDFSNLSVTVGDANIMYGSFINAIINFLIVAFVLFLIVRTLNRMDGEKKAKEEEDKGPSEIELLQQIRDELAKS